MKTLFLSVALLLGTIAFAGNATKPNDLQLIPYRLSCGFQGTVCDCMSVEEATSFILEMEKFMC